MKQNSIYTIFLEKKEPLGVIKYLRSHVREVIYFKILYLIVRPLRRGTAAGGRQGERAAYPTTSHPEMKLDSIM